MFVYIFSMSNEHILVSLFISIVFRSVIRWAELLTLYTYGRSRQFCSKFVRYFANLYPGAFLHLIIGLIGTSGLYVARIIGAVGFIFVYFHVSSFITFLLCFSVNFISFWYCWVGLLLIILKLFSCIKVFIFCLYLSCVEYCYCFSFVCLSYNELVCYYFIFYVTYCFPLNYISLIYYITILVNVFLTVLLCCS
jgi:hypothetical protein